jgi:hypothetical protein
MIEDLGYRVQDFGFRIQGLGLRAEDPAVPVYPASHSQKV